MEEMLVKSQSLSRNQIQERIMIALYQYLFYVSSDEKPVLPDLIANVFEVPFSKIDDFAKNTILFAIKNGPDAVEEISKYLKEFSFERLNIVEQAILLLGFTQIKYMNQPKPVAINVCVKLAQKYADAASFKYINAVLEQINHG
jgi:N utilization substance protein B